MLYNALVRIPESAYQAVTNVEAVHMERWGLGAADWCEELLFHAGLKPPLWIGGYGRSHQGQIARLQGKLNLFPLPSLLDQLFLNNETRIALILQLVLILILILYMIQHPYSIGEASDSLELLPPAILSDDVRVLYSLFGRPNCRSICDRRLR
jgi:hypothetical protein